MGFRAGIGETIAHVEAGGMSAFAVARRCCNRFPALAIADRNETKTGFIGKARDGVSRLMKADLFQFGDGLRRLPRTDRAIAAVVMQLDGIRKIIGLWFTVNDRHDGGGIYEYSQSSSSSFNES